MQQEHDPLAQARPTVADAQCQQRIRRQSQAGKLHQELRVIGRRLPLLGRIGVGQLIHADGQPATQPPEQRLVVQHDLQQRRKMPRCEIAPHDVRRFVSQVIAQARGIAIAHDARGNDDHRPPHAPGYRPGDLVAFKQANWTGMWACNARKLRMNLGSNLAASALQYGQLPSGASSGQRRPPRRSRTAG